MNALFEKLDAREFHTLLLGLGLVITALAVTVALLPGAKAYRAVSQQISVLEEARENAPNLEAHLQERHARIEDLKFRLHGDISNLPFKQIESYVIGRLQKISWRNDVELVSVKPQSGQQVRIFRETLFNIELIGEYEDIYRWLWDAKNELGFVVVKEYSMSRRDTIDEDPQLLAEVSLASYRADE